MVKSSSSVDVEAIGQTFGNYRVVSKISEGGMGAVFLAEHLLIGRRVALKLLLKHLSTDSNATQRFLNEARAVNAIRHPHIVDITDVGTTPTGEHFLAMELLEGQTLSDRLREGPMSVDAAVTIAAQVSGALAAAHKKGIIHRDLKPGNIFLTRQGDDTTFVKVLDFGIAKLAGQDMAAGIVTRTGEVFGTPFYMSPEQCEGSSALDARTDIYSLGVVLFEMLAGRLPFMGEGLGQIVMKHMQQAPPTLRSLGVTVPADLEAAVMRALAKSPADRHATMEEFREKMIRGWAGTDTQAAQRLTLLAPIAGRPTAPPPRGVLRRLRRMLSRLLSREIDTDTATMSIGEQWPTRRTSRQRVGLAIGGVVVVGAAISALVVFRAPAPVPARSKPPVPVATAPAARSVPAPTPQPPPPQEVKIILRSEPPGAEVRLKGAPRVVGITPTELRLEKSDAARTYVLSKPGYRDAEQTLVPSEEQDVLVRLAPVPKRPAKTPPPGDRPSQKALENPWAQ